MHIPERLKLKIHDFLAPSLSSAAKAQFKQAKHALKAGKRDAALAQFAQAVSLDARTLTHPWGLDPQNSQGQFAIIRDRMQTRLDHWYRGTGTNTPPPVARLADKVALRLWADAQSDVRIPTPLGQYDGFDDVAWPRFENQSVVIKPRHGEMARGVLVLEDGFDLMRHQEVTPDLATYAARIWQSESVRDGEILAEALVQDRQRHTQPDTRVPRDFKGFCTIGKVAYVTVQDTNGPGGYQAFRQRRSFDAKGNLVPRTHGGVADTGDTKLPDGFFEVVQAMEQISIMFPQALRLDFYLDDTGPVLGEITTYPNAGLGFAPFSARTFHQMLEVSHHLE